MLITAIDKASELLNIEKHDAVKMTAQGVPCIPVSVVRCIAHEMLITLRDYEKRDNELLTHLEKAGGLLKSLGKLQKKGDADV